MRFILKCIGGGVAGILAVKLLVALGLSPGDALLSLLGLGLAVLATMTIRGFIRGVKEGLEKQGDR